MISRKEMEIVLMHLILIFYGIISLLLIESEFFHTIYVLGISSALFITVIQKKQNLISPISYLILSFLVFVWMRYILNLIFDIPIISVGEKITNRNTNIVAIYLGVSINIIIIISIFVRNIFCNRKVILFECQNRVVVSNVVEMLFLLGALFFFLLFILDSIRKISIVNSADYLTVSETLLTQGYRYFTFGKYLLLLWVIFGKDEDRYYMASIILMLASVGYLMRGARGYAIMYIFLWLLFLSIKRKIRIIPLVGLGIALIFLANFILSYRLGWRVASGIKDVIVSTLNSQGSSVETVFGSVIFHDSIAEQFKVYELFIRNDYGIIVDRVRGTGFEMGGFGSSFFSEIYLGGFLFALLFLILVGVCIGLLEYAYEYIKKSKNSCDYSKMLLFMTIPNLIYLARSSIKDFIFKTVITIIIILILQSCSTYRTQKNSVVLEGERKYE